MHLNFLSDWPPNPRAENKIRKASPFLVSPLLCTCFNFLSFFSPNMERSQRTATRIVQAIFALEQKNKKKQKTKQSIKQKKYNRMIESFQCFQAMHQIALRSLWHQPVGKTCDYQGRNGVITHTC